MREGSVAIESHLLASLACERGRLVKDDSCSLLSKCDAERYM